MCGRPHAACPGCLQRQDVVTALVADLPGDGALAVERIGGHDRALQREHRQQLRHRGDLVRLGVGGDLRQHKALRAAPGTDHVQGRLAAGAIEGAAQDLAVNRHNPLNRIGEAGHEPLEGGTEPRRIEQPEQPTEGVVAGQAVLQLEKAAQKGLFRFREPRHRHCTLTAAQHRAERDHQQLVEVVQPGIAGARVFQTLPAGDELIQDVLPGNVSAAPEGRIDLARAAQAPVGMSRRFQVRIP